MIISKTPFRISFFVGGTDYPVWFEKNGDAVGGKLLGVGGGGFMLLFVRPENRQKVAKGLKDFLEVKFKFESEGSQIIYYNP